MFETLQTWDQSLFLCLNELHSPYWDSFMSLFTGKWIWAGLYASIFYVLFRNFNRRMLVFITLAFILLITISDQACGNLIRPVFERLRPSHDPEIRDQLHLINGRRGGLYGFPSCHASNSFALATFMILLFKNRMLNIFFISWALLTCYTRIYVGVHYPGDLLAGIIVGAASGWLIYGIMRWCLTRNGIYSLLRYEPSTSPILSPEHINNTSAITYTGLLTVGCIAVYSFIAQ